MPWACLKSTKKSPWPKKVGNQQRRAFIDESLVPVVVATTGELFVVDHHHFCVCYHVGINKVRIVVAKDLSKTKMT